MRYPKQLGFYSISMFQTRVRAVRLLQESLAQRGQAGRRIPLDHGADQQGNDLASRA